MFKDFLNNNLPVASQANYVEYGYGQLEPNHLSAQRTGQIYAQLPAKSTITMLEQGQFVKYDYAANNNGIGEVDFTGAGEWMLVFNEIKLYKTHPDGSKQGDCEFAMFKDDYQARVYSPYDWENVEQEYASRYLNGVDASGNSSFTVNTNVDLNRDGVTVTINGTDYAVASNKFTYNSVEYTLVNGKVTVPVVYSYDDVTADMKDIYEIGWTNDPYHKLGVYREKKMTSGTSMVPRVYKTNIGDIFTTNMVNVTGAGTGGAVLGTELSVGDILTPNASNGILRKIVTTGDSADAADVMKWQVVKVYTVPDGQRGVKVMRIA